MTERIPKGVPTHIVFRFGRDGKLTPKTVHGGEFAPKQETLGNAPLVAPEHRYPLQTYMTSGHRLVRHDGLPDDPVVQAMWKQQWEWWRQKHEGLPDEPPPLEHAWEAARCFTTVMHHLVGTIKETLPRQVVFCLDEGAFAEAAKSSYASAIKGIYCPEEDTVYIAPREVWTTLLAIASPPEVFRQHVADIVELFAHELMHAQHVSGLLVTEQRQAVYDYMLENGLIAPRQRDRNEVVEDYATSSVFLSETIASLGAMLCLQTYANIMGYTDDIHPHVVKRISEKRSMRGLLALIGVASYTLHRDPPVAHALLSAMGKPNFLFLPHLLKDLRDICKIAPETMRQLLRTPKVQKLIAGLCETGVQANDRYAQVFMELLEEIGRRERWDGKPFAPRRFPAAIKRAWRHVLHPFTMLLMPEAPKSFRMLYECYLERLQQLHSAL